MSKANPAVRYFEPGTHVWIWDDGRDRFRGTVDARQGGVYRVHRELDGEIVLKKSADISLRVRT